MNKFLELAIDNIREIYTNNGIDMSEHQIFIVWFSKTLKNGKALISTTVDDDKYFEVTYNGCTKEMYIDEYKKQNNTVINCNEVENIWSCGDK